MMKRQTAWSARDEGLLMDVLGRGQVIALDDINQLSELIPARSRYAIYQRMRKLALEHGVSFRSINTDKALRSDRNAIKKHNQKISVAEPTMLSQEIMGAMIRGVEVFIEDRLIKELDTMYQRCRKENDELRSENSELKTMLRKLKDLREAAEKFRL